MGAALMSDRTRFEQLLVDRIEPLEATGDVVYADDVAGESRATDTAE